MVDATRGFGVCSTCAMQKETFLMGMRFQVMINIIKMQGQKGVEMTGIGTSPKHQSGDFTLANLVVLAHRLRVDVKGVQNEGNIKTSCNGQKLNFTP